MNLICIFYLHKRTKLVNRTRIDVHHNPEEVEIYMSIGMYVDTISIISVYIYCRKIWN